MAGSGLECLFRPSSQWSRKGSWEVRVSPRMAALAETILAGPEVPCGGHLVPETSVRIPFQS